MERRAAGLRSRTLRVDAEEVLASPPVTGLIPRGAGFSRRRVASSFHLRPGLVSSSPLPALTELLWEQTASRLLSDATGVIGGSGQCCSHPAWEQQGDLEQVETRDVHAARCRRPQRSDQSASWATFSACRATQLASRLSPSPVTFWSLAEQQALVICRTAHVFKCVENSKFLVSGC